MQKWLQKDKIPLKTLGSEESDRARHRQGDEKVRTSQSKRSVLGSRIGGGSGAGRKSEDLPRKTLVSESFRIIAGSWWVLVQNRIQNYAKKCT